MVDVVMLATNEKSKLYISWNEMRFGAEITPTRDYQPYHLYFLSDEEIKEGDWVLETLNKVIFQVKGKSNDYKNSTFKKIIATTDRELRNGGQVCKLPQPSQLFLEKYVEEYNKGNQIKKVMVEYENQYYDGEQWFYKVKVNSKDNTITIRKVKDSLSREEVEYLLFGDWDDVLVTDAELVLVKCNSSKEANFWLKLNDKFLKPILISRTEKIEEGDWILTKLNQIIKAGKNIVDLKEGGCIKILALPEHFSPEQLQMIVDGKLKEGKCLVECDGGYVNPEWNPAYIKLNPHITIYPVEERIDVEELQATLKRRCEKIAKQDKEIVKLMKQVEEMYTREEMIINAFKFYSEMSVKMGVPFRLISENRDNAVLWFEQNVK